METVGFMWECECGHVERGEESPEECFKCGKMDSFTKLPEVIANEREKDEMEEVLEREEKLK